jgi:hypothetical protein
MQDAFNLAWKLAMVIHGTAKEALLDSYSPERSAVGDEVLKMADRLTKVGTLRNPVAQSVRNLVGHFVLGLTPLQQAFANNMTQVSVGYPHTPLNGPGLRGGPASGERVAPVAGQRPAGSGDTPRFVLFAAPTAATSDLLRRFEGLLDPEIRPPFRDGAIWLVRPDGYVACSAEQVTIIARYLEQLLPWTEPERLSA